MGNLKTLVLTPPKDAPEQSLGFNAASVSVENPTSAYWYLPDQLRFIPPFASGIIIPLLGVQKCGVLYQAPPGLQQPSSLITPGSATFRFTEDDVGNDSGLSLAANAFGRSISVIPFSVPQNSSLAVIIPSGAPGGLEIQFSVGLGGFIWNGISVTLLDPQGILIAPLYQGAIRGTTTLVPLAPRPRYPYLIPAQSSLSIQVGVTTGGVALGGSVLI